jgi:hypothetical protein
MARVTIKGERELARRLARLPHLIDEAVRPAVADQLDATADDERRLVRVRSGTLKDAISAEVDPDGLSGQVTTGGVRYAAFEDGGAKGNPGSGFATAAGKLAKREFPRRVRRRLDAALRRVGRS